MNDMRTTVTSNLTTTVTDTIDTAVNKVTALTDTVTAAIGDAVTKIDLSKVDAGKLRDAAYDRLAGAGCELVTTEMVGFEWLRDCEHPQFRALQALVK